MGDLRGLIEKLDYLKEFGVTAVWLDPEFGTMADWGELVEGLHSRGIRLVMDQVVSHTSDEHRWFQESRSSKVNPYRDY